MKPDHSPPLASLLSKLVDQGLDDGEKARLEELLRANPAAREYYRHYLTTHLELGDAAPGIAPTPTLRKTSLRRARPQLAVAALLLLLLGLVLWSPWRGARQAAGAKALAVISAAEDVRWSFRQAPEPGAELHAGRVELSSGALALNLSGSRWVTLAAPADFELVSDTELFLHRGSASLRIDDGGPSYAIRVPRGTVVDLGTEFSVNVAADGRADVWVFEGKALVSLTSGAAPIEQQALTAGQSLRIGPSLGPSPVRAADFIRPLRRGSDGPGSPQPVIAHFSAEFPASTLGAGQPFGGGETPAPGWSYLWNPTGVLGRAVDYQALAPNTVNTFPAANGGGIFPMFTMIGSAAFNAAGQDHFRFGRIATTSIHPGRYVAGKDYRAIIAYTIQPGEAGKVRIANSSLAKHRIDGFGTNGVDLDIYVNDTRAPGLGMDSFQSLAASDFDGPLGTLSAGDTVYIALGNNGDDGHGSHEAYDAFDACIIDFQLVRDP